MIVRDSDQCTTSINKFNSLIHKPKYTIGVFAPEGSSKAFTSFNLTLVEYLTKTAGQKFDPPLKFDMVGVDQNLMIELVEKEEIDFYFGTPSIYSCLSTKFQATPLVTAIMHRECRGYTYDLDQQGGVMFTLKDSDIQTIDDFKGRTIGIGGITMMGGGQAQIYELFHRGISFLNDPKQVVITGDQPSTLQGVIDGDFEIGFARTDLIERYKDADGNLINQGM